MPRHKGYGEWCQERSNAYMMSVYCLSFKRECYSKPHLRKSQQLSGKRGLFFLSTTPPRVIYRLDSFCNKIVNCFLRNLRICSKILAVLLESEGFEEVQLLLGNVAVIYI